MTVLSDEPLNHDDLKQFVEEAARAGSVALAEIADVIEAHGLDSIDPGGHARLDPRRGEVRLAPRLQVLHLRHLVDPPGRGACARRQGPHDPDDVHIVERNQKMNRADRTLWTRLGREPTLAEIAEEAGLPLHQACEVRAAAHASLSLDQPVGEHEDAVFGDFVASEDPLPEEEVEVSLRSQALAEALGTLSERERQVLALRYGLDGSEPKTLEEIGCRLGLTRERVRQIELETLRRLSTLREIMPVVG